MKDILIEMFDAPDNILEVLKLDTPDDILTEEELVMKCSRRKLDDMERGFLEDIVRWIDTHTSAAKMFKLAHTNFIISARRIKEILERGYYDGLEKSYLETLVPLYFLVVYPTLAVDDIKRELDLI